MQVTETLNEGLKHEFKISVPATDLDAKAERETGRPQGQGPPQRLPSRQGAGGASEEDLRPLVMAETIDQTIRDTNTQIFNERGFRLAGEPEDHDAPKGRRGRGPALRQDGSDLHGRNRSGACDHARRLQELHVEKPVVDVSDCDVDEAIKRIADQSRPYAAKADGAKAETGDRVTIDFVGTIDGVPFDGGKGEGIQLVIGSGSSYPVLRIR
jgi:trigger factor